MSALLQNGLDKAGKWTVLLNSNPWGNVFLIFCVTKRDVWAQLCAKPEGLLPWNTGLKSWNLLFSWNTVFTWKNHYQTTCGYSSSVFGRYFVENSWYGQFLWPVLKSELSIKLSASWYVNFHYIRSPATLTDVISWITQGTHIFQMTNAWHSQIMNGYKAFKVQRPMGFNATENKKFINRVSNSTLQLTFKKMTIHPVWV